MLTAPLEQVFTIIRGDDFMAKLTSLKKITDLSRKEIQSLEKGPERIIEKRNVRSGIAYEYNDEEVELFLMASFFKKCGYSNKDVKTMVDKFYEDRKCALNEAIVAMSLRVQKLTQCIQIAENMANSEITIPDIIKLYHLDADVSYEDIITIYSYLSPYFEKRNINSITKYIELEIMNFIEYVFMSEEEYTSCFESFNVSIFSNQIEVLIESIFNKIGFYIASVLQSIVNEIVSPKELDKEFCRMFEQCIEKYFEKNKELFIEYKVSIIADDIMKNSNKYSFDSKYVQDSLQKMYDLYTFNFSWGFDVLDDFEFRGKFGNSLILKKNLSDNEYKKVLFLSNAFLYFVNKKRKLIKRGKKNAKN